MLITDNYTIYNNVRKHINCFTLTGASNDANTRKFLFISLYNRLHQLFYNCSITEKFKSCMRFSLLRDNVLLRTFDPRMNSHLTRQKYRFHFGLLKHALQPA